MGTCFRIAARTWGAKSFRWGANLFLLSEAQKHWLRSRTVLPGIQGSCDALVIDVCPSIGEKNGFTVNDFGNGFLAGAVPIWETRGSLR